MVLKNLVFPSETHAKYCYQAALDNRRSRSCLSRLKVRVGWVTKEYLFFGTANSVVLVNRNKSKFLKKNDYTEMYFNQIS